MSNPELLNSFSTESIPVVVENRMESGTIKKVLGGSGSYLLMLAIAELPVCSILVQEV